MRSTLTTRLIGAALLVPAFLVWLLSLVIPTVRLVVTSLQSGSFLLRDRDPEFVGFDNYTLVFERGVIGAFLFGISLAVLPLLVFFITGPLGGWLASRSPGPARRIARVVLVLPLAAFAPVCAAFAWQLRSGPGGSVPASEFPLQIRLSIAVAVLGLTCALAVTVYSSVFRGVGPQRLRAIIGVSGIALLAGLAIGIQQFGVGQLFPPLRYGSTTPETVMFAESFRSGRTGLGAAVATLELIVLAVLGLLAATIVILTGLRIRVAGPTKLDSPAKLDSPVKPVALYGDATAGPIPSLGNKTSRAAGYGLIAAAVVIVVVSGLFLLPWLEGLGNTVSPRLVPDWAGTWIAPMLSTVFAVGVAIAGGFGIGALRPLGRFSELLLLPFAPWLFTGTGPFMLPSFTSARASGTIGSFWAVLPPLWIFVAALFIFTMLFRGQAAHETPPLRKFGLQVLPAAAITVVVFWLWQAQDFLWSFVMSGPRNLTAPAMFVQSAVGGAYRADGASLAYSLVTPLWLIPIVVIGAAVAQWFYADRLVITTEER